MRLLTVARTGLALWLLGNLREAVRRIPTRLAEDPLPSVLAPGSPVRYYLPLGPLTVLATAAAVRDGWPDAERRPWLMVTGAGTASGVALTGYLVRTVNLRLFVDGAGRADGVERAALLRRWYGVNAVRMVAVGAAWTAAGRAARAG